MTDQNCDRINPDCKECFQRIFKILESIDLAIRGDNDKAGIRQHQDEHETRITALEEQMMQRHRGRSAIVWFLAGALVAGMVEIIGALADRLFT